MGGYLYRKKRLRGHTVVKKSKIPLGLQRVLTTQKLHKILARFGNQGIIQHCFLDPLTKNCRAVFVFIFVFCGKVRSRLASWLMRWSCGSARDYVTTVPSAARILPNEFQEIHIFPCGLHVQCFSRLIFHTLNA